jgi:S1/P1 Nuclease
MRGMGFGTGRQTVRSAAVAALILCVTAPQAGAWGREGHRLTALVAEAYLTPETKAQVDELLHADARGGKETLADVASWADEYRTGHPETAPWHFVDIPKDRNFDRSLDCPVSATNPKSPWRDCITDRILYFEGRLGDTSLSPTERAVALKFLVHLIGDVHQPFHALGDDRGGGGIAVTFLGSSSCGTGKCNLHTVWDEAILENQGLSEKKYTERLLAEIKENNWEKMNGGEPTTWANVSHHYAVEALAPNGAFLTGEYVKTEAHVVDAELALGGLRLARVLNRILSVPASEAQPDRPVLDKR